jgi:ketosteroid isomerase-like protein
MLHERRLDMSVALSGPVAEYFDAEKAADAQALARCFTDDGVVRDEGGAFKGQAAIERWNADAREKYHHTVEPVSVVTRSGEIVVTGKVSGNFPGSPVNLEHTFRVHGDKIASLEIR